MTARIPITFGIFLLLAGVGIGQEKAESDICEEFLKNSVAGAVILQPFIVREVKGVVLVPYCDDPLPNVLIELRVVAESSDPQRLIHEGSSSLATFMKVLTRLR